MRPISPIQVHARDLRRPHQLAPSLHSKFEYVCVQLCTIDLKRGHACLVTRTDLDTVVECLVRTIAKPKTQALFRQLLVPEIVTQAKNTRHVTAAHLRGRFAHLAVELGRLFDDQYAS